MKAVVLLVISVLLGGLSDSFGQKLYKMPPKYNKSEKVLRVPTPESPHFTVDSVSLAVWRGESLQPTTEKDIKMGESFVLWIRLKATTAEAIEYLKETNFNPIQAKWFRNQNYGYVPERGTYTESQHNEKEIDRFKSQLAKQQFFYFMAISSIDAKREGLYLVRLVFKDNSPVLWNGRPCEIKFEAKK